MPISRYTRLVNYLLKQRSKSDLTPFARSLCILTMIKFIKKIIANITFSKKHQNPVVTWDEIEIVCSCPGEETKRMFWYDLSAVVIETNDQGPWMEDVYFMLFSDVLESSFGIPQCAEGSQELLERLMELPNFNEKAVIKAMGSTINKSFLCWEKPSWQGQEWPGIKAARDF